MTAPPVFTVGVVHRRASRNESYPVLFRVPGPGIAALRQAARCRSCGVTAQPCQAPEGTDYGLEIEHRTDCGGLLDALSDRELPEPVQDGGERP